jgi:UDP-N-acetylglucosamine 2-epimerase (non-hydrolysing)
MLLLCYGTRPEWIKIKPIISELKRNSLEFKVAFTGQQKDIGKFYSDYELFISDDKINRLDSIFAQILIECNKKNIFKDINFVLVQGDTATATAIAIAAFHRKIKLFHLKPA